MRSAERWRTLPNLFQSQQGWIQNTIFVSPTDCDCSISKEFETVHFFVLFLLFFTHREQGRCMISSNSYKQSALCICSIFVHFCNSNDTKRPRVSVPIVTWTENTGKQNFNQPWSVLWRNLIDPEDSSADVAHGFKVSAFLQNHFVAKERALTLVLSIELPINLCYFAVTTQILQLNSGGWKTKCWCVRYVGSVQLCIMTERAPWLDEQWLELQQAVVYPAFPVQVNFFHCPKSDVSFYFSTNWCTYSSSHEMFAGKLVTEHTAMKEAVWLVHSYFPPKGGGGWQEPASSAQRVTYKFANFVDSRVTTPKPDRITAGCCPTALSRSKWP